MDITPNGSITSVFQFLNYKIDKIQFNTLPSMNSLLYKSSDSSISTSNLKISIGFRDVTKFVNNNNEVCYMAGIAMKVTVVNNKNIDIATGEFGIEGLFKLEGNINENTEKMVVKHQFPSILLPYLRSAITNILASAGFGSLICPLINIYKLAEQKDKEQEIKIVDITTQENIVHDDI